MGRAMSEGGVGDTVMVQNPASFRMINGVVTGARHGARHRPRFTRLQPDHRPQIGSSSCASLCSRFSVTLLGARLVRLLGGGPHREYRLDAQTGAGRQSRREQDRGCHSRAAAHHPYGQFVVAAGRQKLFLTIRAPAMSAT